MNAQVKEQTGELVLELEKPSTVPATLPVAVSPLDRITELLERGVSPEQLDKFLDVQQRWEAGEAKKAYDRAMAKFKREPIAAIVKKKRVNFNTKTGSPVDYKHETLDQVVVTVVEPLAKHGFSHHWTVEQRGSGNSSMIHVKCILTHEQGHSESVELHGAPDNSGLKNDLQQVRSTITFLQRATLLLATGLAAKGEDNDGRGTLKPNQAPRANASATESIEPRSKGGDGKATAKQVKLLKSKLERAQIEPDFLKHFAIGAVEDLQFDRVNEGLAWLAEQAKTHGG